MKKSVLLAALLAFLAATLPGQVRLNGYFSSDYTQPLDKSSGRVGSFGNLDAGLIVSGDWTSQFNYVLEMRMGESWKPEIERAYLGWNYSDAFRLRVGLYLVPFGR
ncbi:MAG: porin, partial [Candidatus Aminicenantales bacterium]